MSRQDSRGKRRVRRQREKEAERLNPNPAALSNIIVVDTPEGKRTIQGLTTDPFYALEEVRTLTTGIILYHQPASNGARGEVEVMYINPNSGKLTSKWVQVCHSYNQLEELFNKYGIKISEMVVSFSDAAGEERQLQRPAHNGNKNLPKPQQT